MRLALVPRPVEVEAAVVENEVDGGDPIRRPSKITSQSFTGPMRSLPSHGCVEISGMHQSYLG